MVLDQAQLKKLLKEMGVKSSEDFGFLWEVGRDVVKSLLEIVLAENGI